MAKFKLTVEVELSDPSKCEECQFECYTESSDIYCAASPQGEFLVVHEYDPAGGYLGKSGSNERPVWCPLIVLEM